MPPSIEKVTAFIIRDDREICLIDHPYTAYQIPAGTVEPGEAPEAAVLREAAEETNLTTVTIRANLGSRVRKLPGAIRGTTAPLTVYARPDVSSFDWAVIPRGIGVEAGRVSGDFTQITYREYDDTDRRETVSYQITGWAKTDLLVDAELRHFFRLDFSGDTPDEWTIYSDYHHWRLFWASLDDLPPLVEFQQPWLDILLNS